MGDNPHREFEREWGAEVRKWRKHLRMSQEELVELMTVQGFPMHQTTIAKLERGERPITLAEASALERIFWVEARPTRDVMPVSFHFTRPRLPGLHWIPTAVPLRYGGRNGAN